MEMKIRILALVVMLGVVGRVDAGYYFSAGDLLTDCGSANVGIQNDCVLFLGGVIDTMAILVEWERLEEMVCIPDEVTLAQVRKIYIKYANEHPEELHYAASSRVLAALHAPFACK